jgi:hypothetical protein
MTNYHERHVHPMAGRLRDSLAGVPQEGPLRPQIHHNRTSIAPGNVMAKHVFPAMTTNTKLSV